MLLGNPAFKGHCFKKEKYKAVRNELEYVMSHFPILQGEKKLREYFENKGVTFREKVLQYITRQKFKMVREMC